MNDKTLGPWPSGIDNISQDAAIPAGSLRAAVNVLIDTDGTIDSAPAPRLIAGTAGVHSLWTSPGGTTYCVKEGKLCALNGDLVTELAELGSDDAAAYCSLNNAIAVCTQMQTMLWDGTQLEPAGLQTPGLGVMATDRGGLNAGRYGVAVSLRKGEQESGLSSMLVVDVEQGGGILLDLPSAEADAVSIYRTDANGGALYRAVDAPVGMAGYLLGAGMLGAMPATAHLSQMPGGHLVAAWRGRLLVARGRHLFFSSALRYGLYNPTTDFVSLPTKIRMVLPVNDGIYLADGRRCYRLAGTSPETWQLVELPHASPPTGAAAVIDGSQFTDVPAVPVACWMSEKGIALGLPEGQVVLVQEKRLRLPMPDRGWLVTDGRRLFTGS